MVDLELYFLSVLVEEFFPTKNIIHQLITGIRYADTFITLYVAKFREVQ